VSNLESRCGEAVRPLRGEEHRDVKGEISPEVDDSRCKERDGPSDDASKEKFSLNMLNCEGKRTSDLDRWMVVEAA